MGVMGMDMGGAILAKTMLLITLGFGYIICYLASKAEKAVKRSGYLIGAIIIFISATMLFVNMALCALNMLKGKAACYRPMPHRMMMPQMVPPQQEQAPKTK